MMSENIFSIACWLKLEINIRVILISWISTGNISLDSDLTCNYFYNKVIFSIDESTKRFALGRLYS
jgi:hypothetical protein